MNFLSDTESVYSLDSLEDESQGITSVNCNQKLKLGKPKQDTVPFYKGEVSVESVKKCIDIQSRNNTASTKGKNNQEVKCENDSKKKQIKSVNNQVFSYFGNDTPLKEQAIKQRLSRRKELIAENKNVLRPRHRSVSYVEQFRKKIYGKNDLDTSTYSTAGSELYDRDKSLSFVSCLSGETMASTSELEFYTELVMNARNEQLPWNSGSFQSGTSLTEKSEQSAKLGKSAKQNKTKPIVLSKVEVEMPDYQKAELEKKKSLEKRQKYAEKVKLTNQMKIKRQKERERNHKFQGSCPPLNLMGECFLQPQISQFCCVRSDSETSVFRPQHVEINKKASKNETRTALKEPTKTSIRRGKPQGHNNKNKKASELSRLQERHEREKSLIEAMKNVMLKT